jgi:pilus assembly protein CpaB
VGLALVLGALAAADVGRREAALERRLAPLVPVLVTRGQLEAGRTLQLSDVEVREVPARWAPAGAAGAPGDVAGAVTAVDLPAGAYLTAMDLAAPERAGAAVRRGERAVQVLATGSADLVTPGARVDVLVTREQEGTRLALQDVEVLAADPAPAAADGTPERVSATLRVTLRQAVYLTAAQSFAREVRLLPRMLGDDRLAGPVAVGEGLR